MINKLLKISGLTILFLSFAFVFVSASEDTGTLTTGVDVGTGIEATLVVAPTASPVAGTYHVTKSVTLTASGSTAICYTTDGTTPVCNGAGACTTSSLYSSVISITTTKTVKGIACYSNQTSNSVSSDTYTLTCTTASVSNGSVSAYPTCAVSCDSGYSVSGSTCVADAGGGGGGGGTASTMSITTNGTVTATKSSGGKTTLTDPKGNNVQVKVSSNTVGSNTGFKIKAVNKTEDDVSGLFAGISTTDGDFVGNYFYKFTAEDSDGNPVTEFDKNVKLTFYYDEDALGTIDEEDLVIYYWDDEEEEWVAITNSKVYASSNKIVAYIDHFTYFGLFGAEGVAAAVVDDDDMTESELATKIEQLLGLIFALKAELAGLGGVSDIGDIPATFRFTANLKQGMSSISIKYLQIVLNSDSATRIAVSGVGSPGSETNYFGSMTKAAVIKFQEKYSTKILAPWGFTEGTGYVARTTMEKLNELLGE